VHWTVLIFMAVDEEALAPYAVIDLRDIQRVGKADGINVCVQACWHNAGIERYEVRDGALETVSPPAVTMTEDEAGKAGALRAFLRDARRAYPADHYLLVLWGHAYGFGFGRTAADRVTFPELAAILDEFARARGGTPLEILGCNACRIGKVETVYELRDAVRYLVASQVGVPYQGWPLRAVLSDLVENPSIAPADLAQAMVTRFCDSYRKRTVTMTMLDLQASDEPLARFGALGRALLAEIEQGDEELGRVHEAFVRAANEDEETEPVVDLLELCTQLSNLSHSRRVRDAAADLLAALRAPTLVAKHDGTGPGAARLHGIGLYVPHVGLDARSRIYADLGLEHARMWTDVIQRLKAAGTYTRILDAMSALETETLQSSQALRDPSS
jgi:hypothetical protein